MEVMLHQMLYLYEIFLENMDSDNCYEVLKEIFNTMFGVNSMNVENDCNVVGMLSMNIHNANDDCTSNDKISEKRFLISMSIIVESINLVEICKSWIINFVRHIDIMKQ